MERVTAENLAYYVERFFAARGGELNEETDSEAAFVALAQYRGAFILNTGLGGAIWIGIQNAAARWTDGGKPFDSVRSAIIATLTDSHPTARGAEVYYSEDSVERLRWMADRILEYKAAGTFLMWAAAKVEEAQ